LEGRNSVSVSKPDAARPIYTVRLQPLPHVVDSTRALRSALKLVLRRYGLRAVSVSEARR